MGLRDKVRQTIEAGRLLLAGEPTAADLARVPFPDAEPVVIIHDVPPELLPRAIVPPDPWAEQVHQRAMGRAGAYGHDKRGPKGARREKTKAARAARRKQRGR